MTTQKLCIDCEYCESVKLNLPEFLPQLNSFNVCTHPRFITSRYIASGDKSLLEPCSVIRSSWRKCSMKGKYFVSRETGKDIEEIKKCYECGYMYLDNGIQYCSYKAYPVTIKMAISLFCENNKYFEAKK